MNIKQKKSEFLSVFISHHHKDKDIADIFREAIENWSNCEIIVYKKLFKVLPDTTPKESVRYDQITLALDLEHVEQVKCVDQKADYKKALKCAKELITQNCVVKEFFGEPYAYFNFEKLTENMKFNNLVERWRKESKYPRDNPKTHRSQISH